MRLAVTRMGLGIELAEPATVGPIRLEALVASLPGLSFPIDLSGGVPRFRHRRGALARLEITLLREPLNALLLERAGAVLDPGAAGGPDGARQRAFLSLLPSGTGVTVGAVAGARALAFEVAWVPLHRDVRLVVHGARGIGLPEPAHAAALRLLGAALGAGVRREGSVFRLDDAAGRLLRTVLAQAGARAPSTRDVAWGSLEASVEGWRVVAELAGAAPALDASAVAALETAQLTRNADDALAAGDVETARDRYLGALELAPHHLEIALRLADLDRAMGGRVEAALGTLVTATPAIDAGALGGALLAAVGDRAGARVAFEAAAARELYSPLAALCLGEAAALSELPGDQAALLSAATARAPTSATLRWRRVDAALANGDARAAMGDVEHLEAAALTPLARQEVIARAGRIFLAKGHAAQAMALFERALRYHPTAEEALVGLGQSLAELGAHARAADVFARAISLGERRHVKRHDAVLALARVLAEGLGDLPLAIARARSIPPGEPLHAAARALEGRCLARLGDRVAASVAFSRMRDVIEQAPPDDPRAAADQLFEAAEFERLERQDDLAAKLHLGTALKLRPRDKRLLAAFRLAAEAVDGHDAEGPRAVRPDAPPHAEPNPPRPDARASLAIRFEDDDTPGDHEDEALVEHLSTRLRGDPADLDVALELCDALERLGRDMDLFALVAARLEEGDEATREAMLPRQRAVLTRLEAKARSQGRDSEAGLYRDMLRALG